MSSDVQLHSDPDRVDWRALVATLAADRFDNGRSPDQLRWSFENSRHVVFAEHDGRTVGKARALSDDVCNAYVVDVWTRSDLRRRGIATRMLEHLLDRLAGQHVHLVADDAPTLYESVGFRAEPGGFGRVVGTWLQPSNETHQE